jgi:hypothetical protein
VQWIPKELCHFGDKFKLGAAEERVEEQIGVFLNSIPVLEEEERSPSSDDEGEVSARDRILSCFMSTKGFNPLLRHAKTISPAFYRAVLHHHLLSGKANPKKRKVN